MPLSHAGNGKHGGARTNWGDICALKVVCIHTNLVLQPVKSNWIITRQQGAQYLDGHPFKVLRRNHKRHDHWCCCKEEATPVIRVHSLQCDYYFLEQQHLISPAWHFKNMFSSNALSENKGRARTVSQEISNAK